MTIAAIFEPVGHGHHGGAIHAERRSHLDLRHATVGLDEPQRGGLLLGQAEIGHRFHEIAMHRALCAAQQITEKAIEFREHQFGRFEVFRG